MVRVTCGGRPPTKTCIAGGTSPDPCVAGRPGRAVQAKKESNSQGPERLILEGGASIRSSYVAMLRLTGMRSGGGIEHCSMLCCKREIPGKVMPEQPLRQSWRAIAVAFAIGALVLAGCNKQGEAAKPTTPPAGAPATANAPVQKAPQGQDSDEGTDGPEIPGTIDGAPAMMSEDAFLSAYREVEGVVALNDGLMYRVITSGKGKSPTLSDSVRVSYKGSLMDGSVFDQTKPGETLTLELAHVIAGWREALPMMKEGDRWEVVIPSALAYGEAGSPPAVPPNAPLVFEITLVEVVKG
jgi:hypothetical protein